MLIAASLLVYGASIVAERKRGLGFLSLILSTCSLLAIVQNMSELGNDFLLAFLPMFYVMLMSIVHIIWQGPDA